MTWLWIERTSLSPHPESCPSAPRGEEEEGGAPRASPGPRPVGPAGLQRAVMMCGWGKLTLSLGLLLAMAGAVAPQPCPAQCSCSGSTVDCHGLALRGVPRNIPRNTERL